MIRQQPLTLTTPVIPSAYANLDAVLMQLRADLEKGIYQQFQDVDTIHYFRLVLLPAQPPDDNGNSYPAKFVLSTDYDGDEEAQLTALVTTCTALIDTLYQNCEGYPAAAERTSATRITYLKQWRIKPLAFFAGAPGRTLVQIRQESKLRNYIWNLIHNGKWDNQTASQIHSAVKQNVSSNTEFQWAKQKAPLLSPNWFGVALLGIIMLILLPLILVWIVLMHFLFERKDKPLGLTPSQIDSAHIRKLEEYEDFHNQNQFTQLLIMKPGKMRLITLIGLMLFAKSLVNNIFVKGKLMGIPTIHFARWLLMDDQKRMLFFSNFDGSWQQYLGDFIDKSGWGLTAIWSNTEKFPPTNFLFTGGAYDEEHFLAWSRYYQVPTAVWYCAYPNLSIKNVMNNTYIRNEVMLDANEKQAQAFLNRI